MIRAAAGRRATSDVRRPLRWVSSAASAIGDRDENQDAYWCGRLAASKGGLVFIVADGMGGGQLGAWAAQSATRIIADALNAPAAHPPADRLRAAIAQANAVVHAAQASQADEWGGAQVGCALAACVLNRHTLTVAHVGDVRVYLWRQGRLTALTRDHSWAVAMGDEAAPGRAMRHVLSRAVGPSPQVEPDVQDYLVEPGDVIVVCTDGVWSALPEAQMARLIARTPPKALAERLVQVAQERDAGDNATALTVTLTEGLTAARAAIAVAVVTLLIALIALIGVSAGNVPGGLRLPFANNDASRATPLLTQGGTAFGDVTVMATVGARPTVLLPRPTATLVLSPFDDQVQYGAPAGIETMPLTVEAFPTPLPLQPAALPVMPSLDYQPPIGVPPITVTAPATAAPLSAATAALPPQPTATLVFKPYVRVCGGDAFDWVRLRCTTSEDKISRRQDIYISWDPPIAQLQRLEILHGRSMPRLLERSSAQGAGHIRLDASDFGRRPSLNITYSMRLYFNGLPEPVEVRFKFVQ